jgi:replication factor C subunit 2/4
MPCRIIEPLASRCAKFRFRPLTVAAIGTHLRSIADKEDAHVEDGAVAEIVRVSGGDMRKAITLLQSCSRWRGDEHVTAQDVTDISGVSKPAAV